MLRPRLEGRNPSLRLRQRESFTYSLRGVGGSSENFSFHFVFFPTASLSLADGFSMVGVVVRLAAIERGVVNLLAHPSLTRYDG